MVVKMVNAMGGPFIGDDVMGCARFPQMRGRNMLMFGDCRTRWIRRLYVCMNSSGVGIIIRLETRRRTDEQGERSKKGRAPSPRTHLVLERSSAIRWR